MSESAANHALIDFATLRREVDALLTWACGGGAGRKLDDPVYWSIASNAAVREAGKSLYQLSLEEHWKSRFSSCAYLGHWLLEILGVQLPWVGREQHAMNPLTRLAYAPQSRAPMPDEHLLPGDVILIGDSPHTWHIQATIEHDPDSHTLVVGEYGQKPGLGCHVASKAIRKVAGRLWVGERPLERVLPLEDVIRAAAAAGKIVGAIAWPNGCPKPEDQAAG